MAYPHDTTLTPRKVIGSTTITPAGVVIDLNATISGQPDDAFSLQSPRVVELTNKDDTEWVEVLFYADGSTVTPTYGTGIAIPPGGKVAYSLPDTEKTVIGAVTNTGETVSLSVVCGHGI